MSLADRDPRREHGSPAKPPKDTPQLGVDFDNGEVTFDVRPGESMTEGLRRLIREMWHDVDDETLAITRVKEVTFWGNPDHPNKRFRAGFDEATADFLTSDRIRTVLERAAKRRPRKAPKPVDAERTLVVALADLQIGKSHERFGGTPETIERVANWRGMVEDYARDLRKVGQPVSRVFLQGMGDTTEGCGGNPNYTGQEYKTDLHEADQQEVAAQIHEDMLDDFARWAAEVWSSVMSSNHTENRKGGKNTGTGARSDNRDFMLWRSLARVYRKNPDRYGHVRIWVPRDSPNEVTVDLHGVGHTAIHGDIPKKGSNPQEKMVRWWMGQRAGDHDMQPLPAGRASVVLTAHYHHFWALQQMGADFFGSPSGDGGSAWLTDATGIWTPPGLLVYTVDAWGADNVKVLGDPNLEAA